MAQGCYVRKDWEILGVERERCVRLYLIEEDGEILRVRKRI